MEFQTKNKYKWLAKTCKKSNEPPLEDCICNRKRGLITCTSCHKSFMGRIAERCSAHPEVAYLMDSRNCAFCAAGVKDLQMVAQK